MNIKKALAPVANNAIGIYSGVVFLGITAVQSVPLLVQDAGQAITNKIFG